MNQSLKPREVHGEDVTRQHNQPQQGNADVTLAKTSAMLG